MWTVTVGLTCLLAMLPEQSGKISIENPRLLYGVPGLPRASNKFAHGDNFYLAFDIKGVKSDAEGKVSYSLLTEVMVDGRLEFKHESKDIDAIDSLGGNVLPGFSQLNIGLDQPDGKYTVKVTATEKKTKATASVVQEFILSKAELGIVRIRTTADRDEKVATAIFSTGEDLWLNLSIVGFARDKSKQPNLKISMEILDSDGKPTVQKPPVAEISKGVAEDLDLLPLQFYVSLNRAGKFTIKLKVMDQVSGKSSSLDLPLEVTQVK
ncbi:hypothetical protein EBS67_10605 [bacterium]|nr:hypothetical protein [Gemmataceae bacterium]NBS90435.1 hypothetical protein [bacterium]